MTGASRSDIVDVAGEIKAKTEKAVLFYDGTVEVWLPLSQIEIDDDGRTVTIAMPEWLAKAKGLL